MPDEKVAVERIQLDVVAPAPSLGGLNETISALYDLQRVIDTNTRKYREMLRAGGPGSVRMSPASGPAGAIPLEIRADQIRATVSGQIRLNVPGSQVYASVGGPIRGRTGAPGMGGGGSGGGG